VKFFVCTSIVYLSAVVVAFALSILLAEPKLADASDHSIGLASTRPPAPPPRVMQTPTDSGNPSRPDPYNVLKLDDMTADQHTPPPRSDLRSGLPSTGSLEGLAGGDANGVPEGTGVGIGIVGGEGRTIEAPPKPPDPPKPQPRNADDVRPLRISSNVLQGKVIERRVPIYPDLARRIRLQGDVAVELIISPEGRVESVRMVSGHPMFSQSALDAARNWRFSPTLLNGLPVRVTGVITFVFRLTE